jgi:hypothetical protein
MNTVLADYVQQIRQRATAAPMAARAVPYAGPTQMLLPNTPWDWPHNTGSMAPELFRFADTIPASITPNTQYAPSSDSFATNYRSFLDFIDARRFPDPAALAAAKACIRVPDTDPASSPAPPGWTRVSIAGVLRWKPVYEPSDSALDWTQKVQSGQIHNPGSFVLKMHTPAGASGVLDLALGGATIQPALTAAQPGTWSVTVSARAWGQLALATGSWYNSALMQLGRPYVANAGTFFGPRGLLRGRVSGFLAAYQAKYRYAAPGPVGARLAMDLNRAGRISAFGQPVALVGPPVRADQAEVLLASDAASPVIVAALLEAF